MDELLQIATKKKFCEANFREQQNFVPFNLNCGFQYEYLMSCITLSGKKSNNSFLKISWM